MVVVKIPIYVIGIVLFLYFTGLPFDETALRLGGGRDVPIRLHPNMD